MKTQPEFNPAITYHFNIVNLLQLRDHLLWMQEAGSNPEVGFNMSDYMFNNHVHCIDHSGHECGTVACLAGHATLLSGQKAFYRTDYVKHASNWLNLSRKEYFYLFSGDFAHDQNLGLNWITLDEVIAELNYMIANGCTSQKSRGVLSSIHR